MNYYPFDSRNRIYKKTFGAVAAGEILTLSLLLHKDAHVHNAYIKIQKDGEDLMYYEMAAGDYLEDYRFYTLDLNLSEGLYFYGFHYTSDFGDFEVIKENGGRGIVSREPGEMWQQTVYSPDFHTPDNLLGGIIYQIFPDRFFASGKPKTDVPTDRYICSDWAKVPEHRQNCGVLSLSNDYYGGDLAGICEKLPYLKTLGVSIIYLNPIFEAHSNHRYNTACYEKIDPLLGNENDFKILCEKAKENGITVIFDGVFSHTGDDSIYFNKYCRYGNGGAYNDENSPYRKWFKFGETRDKYGAWWGIKTLPETNEDEPSFKEYILGKNGIVKKWLRAGAGGVRLDVADELPDGFLEELRRCVKEENENAYILGEVWEDASNKISYGKRRKFLQGHQLDSVMNYPFASAIVDFIRSANANAICNTVFDICENYPPCALHLMMNHIGTHDTARILTVLSRNDNNFGTREQQATLTLSDDEYAFSKKRLFAAAVIQYTLPGIPSLFYGDEAGVSGGADPFCRATYPWGKEDGELTDFYKKLGQIRRNAKALKKGSFEPYIIRNGLFSYLRQDGNSFCFVAVNAGANAETFTLPTVCENQTEITLKQYEYKIICG